MASYRWTLREGRSRRSSVVVPKAPQKPRLASARCNWDWLSSVELRSAAEAADEAEEAGDSAEGAESELSGLEYRAHLDHLGHLALLSSLALRDLLLDRPSRPRLPSCRGLQGLRDRQEGHWDHQAARGPSTASFAVPDEDWAGVGTTQVLVLEKVLLAAHRDSVAGAEDLLQRGAPSCLEDQEEDQEEAAYAAGLGPSLTNSALGVQWHPGFDMLEDGHQWAWARHQRRSAVRSSAMTALP